MGCFNLLFIVILTVSKVVSFSCSGQRQSGPANGDDAPIHQQVTTLQYCYIDNCTIMRTDTGEELDITYTTDSLLVATTTDGHTSVIITRLDDELPCVVSTSEVPDLSTQAMLVLISILMLQEFVNGYVFVVHLMFKQLRTTIGKLLMLYSLFIILMTTAFLAVVIMYLSHTGRQLLACHLSLLCLIVLPASHQATATCILHYFAYVLYRSSKLQQIPEEEKQSLYRWYITFILGVMFLVTFLTTSYDLGVNQGAHVLPNGDCSNAIRLVINVITISDSIQKSTQIILFLAYLYYKYQLNKDVQSSTILRSQEKLLHPIAIAMGATVGISHLLYVIFAVIKMQIILTISWLLFLIQQFVIMTTFLCTKKARKMCKERFSKE